MRVEWFDACAALVAFTRYNKEDVKKVADFQGLLVRLFSMLHAVALAEIEDSNSDSVEDINAFKFNLLDVGSIDRQSLDAIRISDTKAELVYHWINQLAVEGMATGVVTMSPAVVSRFFQTLANGMVAFHEAVKLSSVPFPFPYTQTCDWLLLLHWWTTPIIITQWVPSVGWCAVFAFIQVFIVWSLNGIAQELENPFGQDANDLDLESMQAEMNSFLLMLINPSSQRIPELIPAGLASFEKQASKRSTFYQVWSDMELSRSRRSQDRLSEATESKLFAVANSFAVTSSVRSSSSDRISNNGMRSSIRNYPIPPLSDTPEKLPLKDSSIGKKMKTQANSAHSTPTFQSLRESSNITVQIASASSDSIYEISDEIYEISDEIAYEISDEMAPAEDKRFFGSHGPNRLVNDQSKSNPMPLALYETPQKKLGFDHTAADDLSVNRTCFRV